MFRGATLYDWIKKVNHTQLIETNNHRQSFHRMLATHTYRYEWLTFYETTACANNNKTQWFIEK